VFLIGHSFISSVSYMAEGLRLPPAPHPRNRFSSTEFELPPLQDPRDAWEVAFLGITSSDGSYFSTSDSSSRNPIPKSLREGIDFPGGRRAWLVVFGSWCALFSFPGTNEHRGRFRTVHINLSIERFRCLNRWLDLQFLRLLGL
jgi:hypothetical protein